MLGEGYKPMTRLDIASRMVESKLAPIASFITVLLRGKTFTGEDVSVTKEVARRFVPMAAQDIYEIGQEEPELLPLSFLGMFGVGLQTYKDRIIKRVKRSQRRTRSRRRSR